MGQKSVESDRTNFKSSQNNASQMKCLSDSNLAKEIELLRRLDCGTSNLSLEGSKANLCYWAPDYGFLSMECPRRRSLTPSFCILSSRSTLSECAGSFGLSRSISYELIRPHSCSEWRRSCSSDSAVVVEEEAKVKGSECSSAFSFSRSKLCLPGSHSRSFSGSPGKVEEFGTKLCSSSQVDDAVPTSLSPLDGGSWQYEVCFQRTDERKERGHTSRAPSVVISDHTGGGSVSVHVAYAAENLDINELLRPSSPDACTNVRLPGKRLSESSSPSSTGSDSLSEYQGSLTTHDWKKPTLTRRLSDCSTCSYFTGSDDEVEVSLKRPSPKPVRKSSNWRKVRNVVQWTPFIQTYKRYKYPWVQLAGHQGNFKAGYKQGTIMKKLCPAEEKAFESIFKDVLQPFVPEYLGIVEGSDGEKYLQLQDLLSDFSSPCVMDIKMGVRTYLEEELAKARHRPKLRKDMYEKMVQIDPQASTDAENKAKAVTKPRYMVWRETISSTATLGFRIEGVRMGDGTSSKDFKTTRTRDQVLGTLRSFLQGYSEAVVTYIKRLKEIKIALEKSTFFKTHELIGSSLLFVHNDTKAGVWLIDFAKTIPLPNSVKISHKVPWVEGTHEDGYLIGLDNLVDILSCLQKELHSPITGKSEAQGRTMDSTGISESTLSKGYKEVHPATAELSRRSGTKHSHNHRINVKPSLAKEKSKGHDKKSPNPHPKVAAPSLTSRLTSENAEK